VNSAIPRDLERAAENYRLAAAQGHVLAEFKYATYLDSGWGLEPDAAWASHYYKQAADHRLADAQFVSGLLLCGDNPG
jgi:TPR repeat protein